MLGKLIKHEFRATGRILLPLYMVCMILAFIIRGTEMLQNSGILFTSFLTVIYIVIMISVVVATFFLMIFRFWKNLLGEEGYLSMTLPVTVTQHIVSKAIVTGIWSVFGGMIVIVSMFIMTMNADMVQSINSIWSAVSTVFSGVDTTGVKILVAVAIILQAFVQPLYFYASMSIGQLVSKYRGILSIGAYLMISTVSSFISGLYYGIFGNETDIMNQQMSAEAMTSYVSINMFGSIINLVIMGTICFFITKYILSKKLNLQ